MLNPGTGLETRRCALALLFAGVLSACGGGGDTSSTQAPAAPTPAPPAASQRWVSSAAQIDLAGTADSGIDGRLMMADPARPQSVVLATPGTVDSTSVRVLGGQVDATLGSLSGVGPRAVVYDVALAPAAPFAYSLYKLSLDAQGAVEPSPVRLSSEVGMCEALGTRFSVAGQSLAGDEALITYRAPTAATPCAAGGEPRAVKLSMSSSAAPLALPAATAERLSPVGVVHGASGQMVAFLAWQGDHFVRTDASLGNAVALGAADLAGPIDAAAAPAAPGIVTRFGIFVKSGDGLRRYDKSTGRLSDLLVAGRVGTGALVNEQHDEQALYITALTAAGTLDLYRVADSPGGSVTRINTEGPLQSGGLRLTKSYVLYAVEGRSNWLAWRKSDGQRSNVLAGRDVVLASTQQDRVFHMRVDGSGKSVLASSQVDGSDERDLGSARLLSAALDESMSPFARQLRANGAFAHALVALPAPGAAGLSRSALRWVSFESTARDVEAGTLPDALGDTFEAPGVVGNAMLMAVTQAASTARRVFVVRRATSGLAEPAAAADGRGLIMGAAAAAPR